VINFPTLAGIRGEGKFFSAAHRVYISRAPGRLDLMGGNVDYTGGLVFESTIREATWAAAQRRSDARIVFWNPQMQEEGWSDRVELRTDEVQDEASVKKFVNSSPAVRWTSYVLGAFLVLKNRCPEAVKSGASI
jgi:L-arabinokinase